MSTLIFPPKGESEEITAEFDFLSRMVPGEEAATAICTCSVLTGEDPTPALMVSGDPTVSNDIVFQKIIGGLSGVIYTLTCSVRTNLNNILINTAQLAVLPDNAGTPPPLGP